MTYDYAICGAGPAGSVIAQRLAAAGARVALIGAAARPGVEGLSARGRALLAEEGLLPEEGVDGDLALVAGPFPRRGVWGDRAVDGAEWLVERTRLADALRVRAVAAGVESRTDSVCGTHRRGTQWQLSLRSGEVLAAPVLIDARGRRGPQRRGPLLLAYGQRFRTRALGAAGTGIGATASGWYWWAQQGHALWVQAVGRPRAARPEEWLAHGAAQVPALADALQGAVVDGEPVARPAHARLGSTGQDPALWRVGDAALAHDPLSGQGIYEALRGARLAATAILSARDGGDALLAHRFIAERHLESWRRGVRVAASFYREMADCGAFWAQTAAAYEKLAPAVPQRSRGAADAHIERRAVLDNGRILERDVIVTERNPRGVWQIEGVSLAQLKTYFDTVEGASIAAAAAALDRPRAAVDAATLWLQKAGAVLQQAAPCV